jgi:hypothetical protein
MEGRKRGGPEAREMHRNLVAAQQPERPLKKGREGKGRGWEGS